MAIASPCVRQHNALRANEGIAKAADKLKWADAVPANFYFPTVTSVRPFPTQERIVSN